MPSLLQLRRTTNGVINDSYLFFCDKFVKCVVGLQAYNRGIKSGLTFSEIASPSDEGLAYILLENSYKRWNAEFDELEKGVVDSQDLNVSQGAEYTTAGRNKEKKGFTKKYCGWKQSGIEKFNQLVCRIRADRTANGERFDEAFENMRTSKNNSEEDEEMDEAPVTRAVKAENDLEYGASDSEEDESDDDSDCVSVVQL
jgi:hypothetical protein